MQYIAVAQELIHGEKKTAFEKSVRHGELLSKSEAAHLMHAGSAPLDDRADSICLQMTPKFIAFHGLDLVVLVDIEVAVVVIRTGRATKVWKFFKCLVISSRDLAAARHRLRKSSELVVEKCRLQVVQPTVGPPDRGIDFQLLLTICPVISHSEYAISKRFVTRRQCSGVAKRTEYLAGIETESPKDTERSSALAFE